MSWEYRIYDLMEYLIPKLFAVTFILAVIITIATFVSVIVLFILFIKNILKNNKK